MQKSMSLDSPPTRNVAWPAKERRFGQGSFLHNIPRPATRTCRQPTPIMHQVTTTFIKRLRSNDQAAWFELWQTFGPVIRAQLSKWGRGRIGPDTVQDLSQETLAALSESIDRFDPQRGARFSTWLLAIAKHVLGDEMDRRMAQKRGGNSPRAASLDDSWMGSSPDLPVDEAYEAAVFRAKVERAISLVERETEFLDFAIFRLRVLENRPGKEVAESVGVSEPTVSRRLARVRELLRQRLTEVVETYSFTDDERSEPAKQGLRLPAQTPTAQEDADFDDAVANVYHLQMELRAADQAESTRADHSRMKG